MDLSQERDNSSQTILLVLLAKLPNGIVGSIGVKVLLGMECKRGEVEARFGENINVEDVKIDIKKRVIMMGRGNI